MKLMHTKTPDFIQKMHNAAAKGGPTRTLLVRGMETVRGGKWASVKTGQIEELTGRVAQEEGVDSLEMVILNENPEVMKIVLLKARDKDGKVIKIVRFPGVCVFEPLEEAEYEGCKNIITHTTYTLPTEE